MSPEIALAYFLPAVAFVMGACIGSFLNVVIYRLPLGISLDKPRRSFCPHCKKQIPAWLNIPLVTWLMLGGKCKWCKEEIKFRYFLVELLTAICFLAIWKLYYPGHGLGGVISLWILTSFLIAATFIDFDHMIIPDRITLGGLGVGVLCSCFFPVLHGERTWIDGLVASLIGAALGFMLLWCIVMIGKLIFGQIKHEFDEPVDFEIYEITEKSETDGKEESTIIIQLGPEHKYEWPDVFYRSWDRMDMDLTELKLDGEERAVKETFRLFAESLEIDGEKIDLLGVKHISGKVKNAVVPREAMGFGDVKFMAMIGAFLGWQAILITLMAGCCIGAVIGSVQKLMSRDSKVPFGPYLALGAFIWIFTGWALWNWYSGIWQNAFR